MNISERRLENTRQFRVARNSIAAVAVPELALIVSKMLNSAGTLLAKSAS
jgi:hypothetical protein